MTHALAALFMHGGRMQQVQGSCICGWRHKL